MTETAPSGAVVVGVDGSERSKRALEWAAQYARVTGASLTAMVAWHLPTNLGWPLPLPDNWTPEADARAMLGQNVKEVLAYDADAVLTTSVVEGNPAQVLTEASKAASLVVVGSRGRGEFAGMLLGSVSEFLVTHAHWPVVVVRDGTAGREKLHGQRRTADRARRSGPREMSEDTVQFYMIKWNAGSLKAHASCSSSTNALGWYPQPEHKVHACGGWPLVTQYTP